MSKPHTKAGAFEWKTPVECIDNKHEQSCSSSSLFSSSNFTMSISGADEPEDKEPSTSGCSSFLTHSQTHNKTMKSKKKERVKEYLKELKSMVETKQGSKQKMGTLATLKHVLTSMRKIKDLNESKTEKKRLRPTLRLDVHKHTHEQMHPVYDSDSYDSLTSESLKSSDEMQIILSSSDRIVHAVSDNLKYVLGYPKDCWNGHAFDNYLHKKDIVTFNSYHRCNGDSDTEVKEEDTKIYYFRLRKLKSMGTSGFSLHKQDYYQPFQCMAVRKVMTKSELKKQEMLTLSRCGESMSSHSDSSPRTSSFSPSRMTPMEQDDVESPDTPRMFTILYCVPLVTPYSELHGLPQERMFETRHSLFCSYCYVQQNTVPLLGYLPQEMIGVSIFDLYHNDDLGSLFNTYQKVISLKGKTHKSGPIHLRAKNGCWIKVVTDWSSFVNPWTKQLEFIIGKHTVIKGPENIDVFSENYHMPSLEETPDEILQARQKIKDLLLQPVQTSYVGSSNMVSHKPETHNLKTVAIAESQEKIGKVEQELATSDNDFYQNDNRLNKAAIFIKDGSIRQAYDQLNYTNGIKKFLLSLPHTHSSDSSSSDEALEEAEQNVPTDRAFNFAIRVPKPPSFGSSTKVLVSEQEHRDNELRDQLPAFNPVSQDSQISTDTTPVVPLTCESLWKHTMIQEQLYIVTASDRNILFANESVVEEPVPTHKCLKMGLKRSHSPDRRPTDYFGKTLRLMEKTSTNTSNTSIRFPTAILNPTFPLSTAYNMVTSLEPTVGLKSGLMSPPRVPVPMQMYPIVTLSNSVTNSSKESQFIQSFAKSNQMMQQWPHYQMSGSKMMPQVMVGFHQSTLLQPHMPHIGLPIPAYQLNSYIMQQANMMDTSQNTTSQHEQLKPENATKVTSRLDQQTMDSSMEESFTDGTTGSSDFFLETSKAKMKMAYSELVMQSMAHQITKKVLNPAPWLENMWYTDSVDMTYQMPQTKSHKQLSKDREYLDKHLQPAMVMDQLDMIFQELSSSSERVIDQEQDYLIFIEQDAMDTTSTMSEPCTCVKDQCCQPGAPPDDHGLSNILKNTHKVTKTQKRAKKQKKTASPTKQQQHQLWNMADGNDDNQFKMETDLKQDLCESESTDKPKTDECSVKSESVDCDMSMDSCNTCSEITPSDQRSNNDIGSSIKESDGDTMSKKSDSCLSEGSQKQSSVQSTEFYDQLFQQYNYCYPQLHKDVVPWLTNVDFNDEVKFNYFHETKDIKETLQSDMNMLKDFKYSDVVQDQLQTLFAEIETDTASNAPNQEMVVVDTASVWSAHSELSKYVCVDQDRNSDSFQSSSLIV